MPPRDHDVATLIVCFDERTALDSRNPGLSLQLTSVFPIVIAAIVGTAGSASALDTTATGCLATSASNANLDRVPDCMRVGRHVRVESSISRGTAALGDGMNATAYRNEDLESGLSVGRQRVRVPAGPAGALWSGPFGRR